MSYHELFDHLGNRRYRPDNTMRRHYIQILRRWMLVVIGLMVWAYLTSGWTA